MVNESKIVVPFKREADLENPNDWIAIDVNESNVTAVSSNPHILKINHELRAVHTTYFNIRGRVQKLAKHKPKTARRLLKKYSSRERMKTRSLCHKISREVVDFAEQHGFRTIMEDLKGVRNV
jgi:putative transposase